MNIYSFEGYIFDLDGTLLDSMEVWRKIYAAPFKEAGMSMPKNLLEQINHLSLNDSARFTVERTGLPFSPSELVQKWTGPARWVYAHDVRLKEGAKELLLELYRRGKRIGIATANPQGIFEACLKREGIAGCFPRANASSGRTASWAGGAQRTAALPSWAFTTSIRRISRGRGRRNAPHRTVRSPG